MSMANRNTQFPALSLSRTIIVVNQLFIGKRRTLINNLIDLFPWSRDSLSYRDSTILNLLMCLICCQQILIRISFSRENSAWHCFYPLKRNKQRVVPLKVRGIQFAQRGIRMFEKEKLFAYMCSSVTCLQ